MMITASHNPNGWSGFKLGDEYSKTIGPEEIKEIFNILQTQDFSTLPQSGVRNIVEIRKAYIDAVISRIHMSDYKPKVVLDAGNGGAGLFAYEIFQKLGCLTFQLNCDPDTAYSHYFSDPSNLKARERLAQMVTHSHIQADLGLAFDGDGDRLGVVDQYGNNIWSDRILIILASQLLEKKRFQNCF